jgi:hypothetical protein
VPDVPQFVLDRAAAKESIFTADEVAIWPTGMLDELVSNGVLIATENATSVVCDSCGNDHIEKVEYIEAPAGTGLRAYIFCDENGRVRVPLDRLRCWLVNRSKLTEAGLIAPPLDDARSRQSGRADSLKRSSSKQTQKRSWTQVDLDEAIRKYKAERASTYNDLVDGVKQGRAGARKSARDLFGRNVVVRALGVKSAAMVSNSPVWQAIADELKLRGPSRSKSRRPTQRIGLDIAVEDQAQAVSTPVLDQAVQQETIRLIEKSMPATEAEATIEKLLRGEISDDAARDIVDVFAEQERDKRTRKVRQAP